ncbi:MAG: DUF4974 domain-containing protein [Bacteroides sp.]|nr:DUF4974 domain-containing protein [Bacteroides sp.]
MNENKEINFIAVHYRQGHFSTNEAWRRLGIASPTKWKRMRIAAVTGGILFLSATAAVIYHQYAVTDNVQVETVEPKTTSPIFVVKVIDFENTPLPMVIERIKEVYDVEITNIPDNAEEYKLSLHYEGTAIDLVETINDILDTQMAVKQQ